MRCKERSAEWIFPSNRLVEIYLPPDHDTSSLPPLHIFRDIAELNQAAVKGVVPLYKGNDSILESSKDVLETTNRIFVWIQFTRQQMKKRLEELQKEVDREYHYPYEWVLILIPIIGVNLFLLIGYFRHDNQMWTMQSHLSVVRVYVIHGADSEYETPDAPHTSTMSMSTVQLPEEIWMLPIPSVTETRIPRCERSRK